MNRVLFYKQTFLPEEEIEKKDSGSSYYSIHPADGTAAGIVIPVIIGSAQCSARSIVYIVTINTAHRSSAGIINSIVICAAECTA